jgi:membrane-associated phospholipid phosphatase
MLRGMSDPNDPPERRPVPWIALIVATAAAAVGFTFDARLVERMGEVTRPVERAFSQISHFGDWPYLAGVALVLLLAATALRRADARRVLLCMIVASTVAGIAANLVRGTTGRARPEAFKKGIEPGWYGIRHDGQWIIGKHRYNAFPSSHSAAAAGFFGVLLFTRRRAAIVAGLLLIPPVPLARLVMNQHHLSDVLFGSLLGLMAAWWTWNRWGPAIDGWWMRSVGGRIVREKAA